MADSRLPRLLIVDDEVDACHNLADILSDLGYHIDIAHDGPTALALVRNKVYDVALLDLKMPGMNGVELYRRIRSLSAGTVAIVVTAAAGGDLARSAVDAGVAEILPKPVDLQRLLSRVEKTLDEPLIMIVDDDPELCESMWEVLREHHYRVGLAHDVAHAKEKLAERDYHVVLIDMKLPGGSGAEVFRLVRQTCDQAKTILITGYQNETEREIADVVAAGADAVAYKPFDVGRLIETLAQLAKKSAKAN